jgi:hypothetical protein
MPVTLLSAKPPAPDMNSLSPTEYVKLLKIVRLVDTNDRLDELKSKLAIAYRKPVKPPKPPKPIRNINDMRRLEQPQQQDPHSYKYQEDKDDEIRSIKSQISELTFNLKRIEANDLDYILLPMSPPLHVGQIGCITSNLYIENIINDNNSIVGLFSGYSGRFPTTQSVWIRGVSTKDLADGSKLPCPKYMRVTGTDNYFHPVGAKNTLFVLEPIQLPLDN